ncbi:SET domain-containing protein 14 [Psilocybe cubensis]|uniref:SET domain-containing protein 14 n=2 Tax=Psilocybe cubensis TaxID=181762 RepID=A0ACB8GTA3_PSICU|nr:SET domain-containing protein 14 [Psilocybe cubensis]KAH9478249.1 SET domain-containing protein 14 [Psilocybe cubensis]
MPPLLPRALGRQKCQYCHKENSKRFPLKTCAQCQRSSYCSRECQKKDWREHKELCGRLKEQIDLLNQASNESPTIYGLTLSDTASKIKKWSQHYSVLLAHSYTEALKLWHGAPNAYQTHLLVVYVVPKFTKLNAPQKTKDIWTAFGVADAVVVPIAEIIEINPEMAYSIKMISEMDKTPEARRGPLALVYIAMPEFDMCMMAPLGLSPPPKNLPPWDDHWKTRLQRMVDLGVAESPVCEDCNRKLCNQMQLPYRTIGYAKCKKHTPVPQ